MWDKVLVAFHATLDKSVTTYLTKAASFDCTEEENATSLATLRRRAWLALRSKVDEQTADAVLLGKLRAHFEERFRYDEAGVPRVWKPADDIDGAFRKARDEVSAARKFKGLASIDNSTLHRPLDCCPCIPLLHPGTRP